MKNNVDINRNERLFDSMIEVAAEEAMIQRLSDIPTREELDEMYPASIELQNRINKIIAKENRSIKRNKLSKLFMRVAAGIGIAFTICSIALMSVEASRNIILNTIIRMQHDHVVFEFSGDTPDNIDSGINQIRSFNYMGSQIFDRMAMSVYENENGNQIMLIRHYGENLSAALDIDYRDFIAAYVGEHQVHLFEAFDEYAQSIIMWQSVNAVYHAYASISIEELLDFVKYILSD
jgi:hypothetical protein